MSASQSCYYKSNGAISSAPGSYACGPDPAGGAASCCHRGHICLSNGFCGYFDGTNGNGKKSGYYLAGCTDSNYAKPGCRTECDQWDWHDVVYSYTGGDNNTWSCCGATNGSTAYAAISCYPPQGPNFSGPDSPPVLELVAYASVAAVGSSGTAIPWGPSSMTTTVTATAVAASSIPGVSAVSRSHAANSLSASEITAIVIGIVFGLSWIAIGIAWICFSRRRKQRRTPMITDHVDPTKASSTVVRGQVSMIDGRELPYQLEGSQRVELPSQGR